MWIKCWCLCLCTVNVIMIKKVREIWMAERIKRDRERERK